jgi:hypothetical protein
VKLVMTLVVRDEVDVVAAMLEHHLAAGVDFVIATDNSSVDGTTDVLAAYQQAGVLEFRIEPAAAFDQAGWVTSMARRAAGVHGADWVINADADEFWWPRDAASLTDVFAVLPPQYGTIEAPRENLIGERDVPAPWSQRLVFRDLLSLQERGGRIGAKAAHRGDPHADAQMGNHGVSGPGIGPRWPASPMTILHAPVRSYQQVARKVTNGAAGIAANPALDDGICWHWREDFARLQAGEFEATWRSRQLDAAEIAAGIAAARLVPDRRLRDRLNSLLDTAVVPSELKNALSA